MILAECHNDQIEKEVFLNTVCNAHDIVMKTLQIERGFRDYQNTAEKACSPNRVLSGKGDHLLPLTDQICLPPIINTTDRLLLYAH